MKTYQIYLFVIITYMGVGCKSSKDPMEYSKSIATERLGPDCECVLSESETYTLCTNENRDDGGSGMGVDLFVVQNDSKEIIFEESIEKGSVYWMDDTSIALFYTPGIMRQDQSRDDYTYVYDLVSKEKTLKSQLE